MLDVILRRFETPDETRTFEKARFERPAAHDSLVIGDEPYVSLQF